MVTKCPLCSRQIWRAWNCAPHIWSVYRVIEFRWFCQTITKYILNLKLKIVLCISTKNISNISQISYNKSHYHQTQHYIRNKLHYSIPYFWTTMGVRLNQDEGEAGHEAKLLCRWCWCRITVNVSVMILVIWSLIDIFIENGWYINFITFFSHYILLNPDIQW